MRALRLMPPPIDHTVMALSLALAFLNFSSNYAMHLVIVLRKNHYFVGFDAVLANACLFHFTFLFLIHIGVQIVHVNISLNRNI